MSQGVLKFFCLPRGPLKQSERSKPLRKTINQQIRIQMQTAQVNFSGPKIFFTKFR